MTLSMGKRRYPFYTCIVSLVLAIVVILTGLFLWISHRESSAAAVKTADRLFTEINEKVAERYGVALSSVAVLSGTAIRMPSMAEPLVADGMQHPAFAFMFAALKHYDFLYSLYCGYEDGGFFQIISLAQDPESFKASSIPSSARYMVRTISPEPGAPAKEIRRYLDEAGHVLLEDEDRTPEYNHRKSLWYTEALKADSAVYTPPHVIDATKLPGITCAEALPGGRGVFGADITLQRFAQFLQNQKISEHGTLFLFDTKGHLLAYPGKTSVDVETIESDGRVTERVRLLKAEDVTDPLVHEIVSGYAKNRPSAAGGASMMMDIGHVPYIVRLLPLGGVKRFDQVLVSAAPMADFTGHLRRMQKRTALLSCAALVFMIPVVLWFSRRISGTLRRLEKESEKVQRFDFSDSPSFDSRIKELHANVQAFWLMKSTIRARTEALIRTQKKLEALVDSGIALSAEKDMERLLHTIFDAALTLAMADGGALYTRNKEDRLHLEILQTASREMIRGEDSAGPDPTGDIPLYDPGTGTENHHRVESHVALTGETVLIEDTMSDKRFHPSIMGPPHSAQACLTVALKPREGENIGILQFFKSDGDQSRETMPFDRDIVGFVEALSAQAALALHNMRLLEEQRRLFDAFIQLIAGAIDAKSPYTGGHCARVPEVATLLARAAGEATTGPFAGFQFTTEDQWQEFRVAAWLHDCGKVTTPEYVVDKATKLETLYNRIHEIRMRFEVLLRDARIDYYQKRLQGDQDEAALRKSLDEECARIRDDFEFVAHCNVGGEFMSDAQIERLQGIAGRTWQRYMDDRIGISQEEALRKSQTPAPQLPVQEPLLADKPEHFIPRVGKDLAADNAHGFNMAVPPHLHHLGELHNLSIRRGTLTAEERYRINEHITQTIIMLEKLPFPAYLRQVAEYAGAHHETMVGSGYPRGLTKAQMSVPARIMAIADIFEALTAADRPYKEPKSLSQALIIMSRMRDDQHIDADLFDLFLDCGVPLAYARRFMTPDQIDDVDFGQYKSKGEPADTI